jgi:hypothetical protein
MNINYWLNNTERHTLFALVFAAQIKPLVFVFILILCIVYMCLRLFVCQKK